MNIAMKNMIINIMDKAIMPEQRTCHPNFVFKFWISNLVLNGSSSLCAVTIYYKMHMDDRDGKIPYISVYRVINYVV